MLPKSGLACLLLLSCLSVTQPAQSQVATEAGVTKVSTLETRFFAHPYNSEDLPHRVARLEKFIYGTESSDSLESRIGKLVLTTSSVASAAVVPLQQPHHAAQDAPQNLSHSLPNKLVSSHERSVSDQILSHTKYPRVTELEQEIFDKSFETDAVPTRIARLEDKVFGRVWATQTDLAIRVDRLSEYAFMSPKVEELERAEMQRVSYLRNVAYQPQATRKLVVHTVVDEIESMETLAFGKISASKPIAQRVDALEVTLFGATQSGKQQNITTRVALLFSKFNNSIGQNRAGV